MAFGWNRLSGGAGSLAAYLVALVPLSATAFPTWPKSGNGSRPDGLNPSVVVRVVVTGRVVVPRRLRLWGR